jgi:hypothetical protein
MKSEKEKTFTRCFGNECYIGLECEINDFLLESGLILMSSSVTYNTDDKKYVCIVVLKRELLEATNEQ